jgi:3-deoxy-D-manno-octulosonic-acid transferase
VKNAAVYFAYNILLFLILPLLIPYLLWRVFAGKETMESLLTKLGRYKAERPPKGGIWIHAVSVGEVNAAAPLAELLASRVKRPVIFSVSTQTGMAIAKKRLGGRVFLTWFPLDFPFSVSLALARFSPSVAVVLETEIWPNFIFGASHSGVKCVVANGRISDWSFGRYKALKGLVSILLGKMDLLLMQSQGDAERAVALGADKGRVRVVGNVKFDLPAPKQTGKAVAMEKFGVPAGTTVVVFASTHPGEEELFLETAGKLSAGRERLFFVVAPRHVERAPDVCRLCEKFGFNPVRRSSGKKCGGGEILVLDTMGELARLYEAADVAVMGGSFVAHGGQNPLEASAWGAPVVFGPHMENFREISQKLTDAGGAVRAADKDELLTTIDEWLARPAKGREAGEKGRETVVNNRGALEKTAKCLEEILDGI